MNMLFIAVSAAALAAIFPAAHAAEADTAGPVTYGDWRSDAPGRRHRITLQDLPAPHETRSASHSPRIVAARSALPKAPEGFEVRLFAEDLDSPRQIRTAPNGDLFVAETAVGRVRVLRPSAEGTLEKNEVFADDLDGPFGIAFYPPGPQPQWVYFALNNAVVRYSYQNGQLKAQEKPETVVNKLSPTSGGHSTRDLVFSADGTRMFASVGSASNIASGIGSKKGENLAQWEARKALGAAWDYEEDRADVLVFTPDGKDKRTFAAGLRNCAGLARAPGTDTLFCATNERDGLGDNLPPDYVTRVGEGAFYGWPWYYMGGREDPRWKGERPDLKDKVTTPDVLIQPHSAPLGMTFYEGEAFPDPYRTSAFVALHGSWNRAQITGYKVIAVPMQNGVPTGEYIDFLTGFVLDANRVIGRPVGVAAGKDGALYVTEDGNGAVYRIAYRR